MPFCFLPVLPCHLALKLALPAAALRARHSWDCKLPQGQTLTVAHGSRDINTPTPSREQIYKYPNSLPREGKDFAVDLVSRATSPPAELSQSHRTLPDSVLCLAAQPSPSDFHPSPQVYPRNRILVLGESCQRQEESLYTLVQTFWAYIFLT